MGPPHASNRRVWGNNSIGRALLSSPKTGLPCGGAVPVALSPAACPPPPAPTAAHTAEQFPPATPLQLQPVFSPEKVQERPLLWLLPAGHRQDWHRASQARLAVSSGGMLLLPHLGEGPELKGQPADNCQTHNARPEPGRCRPFHPPRPH